MSQVRAFVDIDEESDETAEGHYYAPDASSLSFAPSDLVCSFCSGQLQEVRSRSIFGRIVKDEEKRKDGKTSAIVDVLPQSHTAYMCDRCDLVFTINRAEAV